MTISPTEAENENENGAWAQGLEPATLDADLDLIDTDEEEAGDSSRLPLVARRALASLLTSRFITRARNRAAWDAILAYEDELRERLADMFLHLVVDREYEVAFKRQDPREDAPKILRRDKPISRDATLLLLHLRKEHMYSSSLDGTVVITRTEVAEFLRPFRVEGDADDARFERRVDAAIRAVADLRLLTQDSEVDYLFLVSPAVVPLLGAEEIGRLEHYFRQAAAGAFPTDPDPDRRSDETAGTEADLEESEPEPETEPEAEPAAAARESAPTAEQLPFDPDDHESASTLDEATQ